MTTKKILIDNFSQIKYLANEMRNDYEGPELDDQIDEFIDNVSFTGELDASKNLTNEEKTTINNILSSIYDTYDNLGVNPNNDNFDKLSFWIDDLEKYCRQQNIEIFTEMDEEQNDWDTKILSN